MYAIKESEKTLGVNVFVSIAAAVLLAMAARVLARVLPAQNVALIIGCLIASELALHVLWTDAGLHLANLFFWPAAVIWARIGSRWFLRRGRRDWNYGLWLIVLASAVVALMQFAVTIPGASLTSAARLSAIRFAVTAFCLFWLSPWFISKLPQQPQQRAQ